MDKINNELAVQKANQAIAISGRHGLLARKIFNVLLFHARKDLEKSKFILKRSELAELVGYNSQDDEQLKEALRLLMTTIVEWSVIRPGKKRKGWAASTLVADAELLDGQVSYSFSESLKGKLLCPEIYTFLHLERLKLFSSKHSLAIYELLKRYEKIFSTGWISLGEFRKFTGTTGKYYNQFGQLNRKVIRLALGEINSCSDISAELEVRRTGRRISDIKFRIKQSEEPSLFSMNEQLQVGIPTERDYREEAKTCWQRCFGNCGSRWDAHKDKIDECRYCQKFSSNRQEQDIQADVDRAYDSMKQEKM